MAEHPLRALRVDHVGSLLRPKVLIDAFLAYGRKAIGTEALEEAIDNAVRAVVARQEAIGLPLVSDGEFRRLNWQVSFSHVEGWDQWESAWKNFLANPGNAYPGEQPLTRGQDAVETFKAPATAPLSLRDNFPLREFQFLQSTAKAPAKAMLMGPDRVLQMCDLAASAPHYTEPEAFLADVVAIERRIVGELIAAGCSYIQLDEPSYTGYVDPPTLRRMRLSGADPMANLRRAISASNSVIAGHRAGAIFAIHICRGNRASMWHREGSYVPIAEELFATLAFDRLLLEYDTERAGSFEPLRFVPKGPIVVLGLITTKTGTLESLDALRRRIDDAARFIDADQLALSPQCGFASGIAGNHLSEDDQWRKLDLMLETARRVWG
jgi:5-methyltetrahydropteroyltriglutamate--homocysteine methyltransferase